MQSRPINQYQEINKVIEALNKDKDRGQKSRLHICYTVHFPLYQTWECIFIYVTEIITFMFPSYRYPKQGSLCSVFLLRQASKCPTIDKRYCDWKMSFNCKITENKNIRQNQVLCIRGQTTSKTFITNFTYYAHWPPTKRTNYNKVK